MTAVAAEFISVETISLLIGIITPIAGVAFGLGALYTKLNQQREDMKKLKENADTLQKKLDAYLLAAEELNGLRREQINQQKKDMKKLTQDVDILQKALDACLLDIRELNELVKGQS